MFKLDDNLLKELGLGTLPAVEKNRMLGHIYETLEMRVGMKLAQKMTNEQLDEFESFIDKSDEAGALKWLETNFPNYKEVVAEELDRLKSEIKTAAPQIIAASQQAASQATAPTPMPQVPQQPMAQPAMPQSQPPQFQQPAMPQPSPASQPNFGQPAQPYPQQNPAAQPQSVPYPNTQPYPQSSPAPQQPQNPQYPTPPTPPYPSQPIQ